MNSAIVSTILSILNPTLDFSVGAVNSLTLEFIDGWNEETADSIIEIARADWDSFETSWDFARLPWLPQKMRDRSEPPAVADGLTRQTQNSIENASENSRVSNDNVQPPATAGGSDLAVCNSVEECWNRWKQLCDWRIARMRHLETENNRLFITAYGLEDELSPEVPLEQITLMRADAEKDTRRLLSYFVACLMGRYSLDEEGLIYADAGGKGFDPLQYQTFPADDDGIVPVTDLEWFPQEAARQFEKFVAIVYSGNQRKEINRDERDTGDFQNDLSPSIPSIPVNYSSHAKNMKWIAEQLGAKANETPVETVRRYFSTSFFKDHMQTYKKRPIYWLFSSGKQKAFECLVYLHRYNDLTLSRMRNDYVTKLFGHLSAQIEEAQREANDISLSTPQKRIAAKNLDNLQKKYAELQRFDEELRHLAEKRISIDLDDGVKVNYGKFGNLLAEVKAIAAKD